MAGASVKLGFCPIGKFVFSHEDALRYKALIEEKLRQWQVDYVTIDGVLPDGIVRDQTHVDPVVDHFKRAGVDAVFMPHCNFGTEGAVGMIGAKLGRPVLLWGPRDEAPLPDGRRLRDTLCGLFASSKVLHKLNVPFTYIENCRVDDPVFQKGVDTFLRAVNVADALRSGVRIGHIGQRIDFFWTTIVNESELLERFHVEVLPLDMVEFIRRTKQRASGHRTAYQKELNELKASAEIVGFDDDAPMINVLATRDEMLELGDRHNLAGFAIQDFNSLIDEMGAYCFYADSAVADRYPVGYESDIHGALTGVLLSRAAYNRAPTYLVDLTIRHPANDNGILLWHAGAPLSMRDPADKVKIGHHWILPSPLSGMTHFRLHGGALTTARFDGDRGEYQLAIGQGRSIDGPYTQNNYVWMEVDDWPHWERTIMQGPFIHHTGMLYGHYGDALVEACKYVPGLQPVRLDKSANPLIR
ncbi:MAG: fucose isomerase [Chloroflexi bacterium]|nr:fucose isomerase [Chloroflexota bacterium]MCL5273559.1 fucose isomerase [Chloroflexota bacterium]